jgi:hypothetical protein
MVSQIPQYINWNGILKKEMKGCQFARFQEVLEINPLGHVRILPTIGDIWGSSS